MAMTDQKLLRTGLGRAGGTWTPANLAAPPSFWGTMKDASKLTLVSSTHISAVASKSGALAVTQATDAKRPVYDATGINGHPGGIVAIAD